MFLLFTTTLLERSFQFSFSHWALIFPSSVRTAAGWTAYTICFFGFSKNPQTGSSVGWQTGILSMKGRWGVIIWFMPSQISPQWEPASAEFRGKTEHLLVGKSENRRLRDTSERINPMRHWVSGGGRGWRRIRGGDKRGTWRTCGAVCMGSFGTLQESMSHGVDVGVNELRGSAARCGGLCGGRRVIGLIGAELRGLSTVGCRRLSSPREREYENYSDKRGIRGCHPQFLAWDRFRPFSPASLIIFPWIFSSLSIWSK